MKFREQPEKRLDGDLGLASHTAISMVPTATERSPGPPGFSLVIMAAKTRSIVFFACLIQKRGSFGLQDARGKTLPDQVTLAVAAIGVKSITNHNLLFVPDDVGDDRHQAGGHLGEVYVGVYQSATKSAG
jgi:hypothetical protein